MTNWLQRLAASWLFDRKDHDLLEIVNDVLKRRDYSGFRHLLTPYLHPRGIKELAATQGLRIAYAAVNLMGSLELGKANDRLVALRALRDEVMNASVTYLRMNTARVLIQIMKELVRCPEDPERRLKLAHDFRMAATGKPRVIARQLERYHLIPMPEDWVQICFDDHVHDANTKGRKSATHLIMDAWIKGIRRLTIIYYNYIAPEVAEELFEAAKIMDMKVRLGIEFQTRWGVKQAKIVWTARGFSGPREYMDFLRQPNVAAFMEEGRKLSKLRESLVFQAFEEFNAAVLPDVNDYFGIAMPPVTLEGFVLSVGAGQASLLHLGIYIHSLLLPHLEERLTQLRQDHAAADSAEKAHIEALVEEMNALDADAIIDDYLEGIVTREANRRRNGTSRTPAELIDAISRLRVGSRYILNLQGLTCEDVLGILHHCGGRITHLEIVNLKNSAQGQTAEYARIAQLQRVINAPSLIPLKRWVMTRLEGLGTDSSESARPRREALEAVLPDIAAIHGRYRNKPLGSSLGTDSTGKSCRSPGMGLVVSQTLSPAARAGLRNWRGPLQESLAVGVRVNPLITLVPRESTHDALNALYRFARRFRVLQGLGYESRRSFKCREFFPTPGGDSNIAIMGGMQRECGNDLSLDRHAADERASEDRTGYLNSRAKNLLKIGLGFIPACLSFFFTRDWWVLRYFGALIWFSITALRNIIQSVLGGGGLKRTPLLHWDDYVSWSRLSDSLLFTGFSVPLLDLLVKTVLLDQGLGVTVDTNPMLLYAVMGLVNGCYLSGHNIFRGLPRAAVFGNFFRSVLSIPLAVAFNATLGWVLNWVDPGSAGSILQQWAAVISKLASDCVAAVIEGLADRDNNMRQRLMDYRAKFDQMLAVQERLEVLFPQDDVPKMLADPKAFLNRLSHSEQELENAVIVNSLDFLYFWMWQPRGMDALKRLLREMPPQTRQVFVASQSILLRKREISQLFLDGLLGKNFSRGLAFYLDYADGYLKELERLVEKLDVAHAKGAGAGQR